MEASDKRIVKNTVYLYIRQFIILALSFVSTRIVLDKLGASDYGVNNLVAGFVSMFTVLNGILNTSTSRFMSLALGKNNPEITKKTFSTAVCLHLIIGLMIVLILETFGLWFLNAKLNIETDRMFATNVVFQISVLSTFLGITQTPYSAAVTSHEDFNIYAFMSIYDVVAKILVLFLLVYIPYDKLIIYSLLTFAVSLTSLIIYNRLCHRKYKECSFSLHIDKPLCKEMLTFSGWSVFGQIVFTLTSQGISILLNMFYNTVMNAARGLANTVLGMITQFITGFMVAAQPQLVKYYGAGDMKRFSKLIFDFSQYTLLLVAIMTVPVVLEIDYVLDLWLGGNVPPYTSAFIRITMVMNIVYKGNQMVENGIIAIGRMKELNTYSIPIQLITLPLFYFALKMNFDPAVSYCFATIAPTLCFFVNLYLLSKFTPFDGKKFFINVFLKTAFLILISGIAPFIVQRMMDPGLLRFLVVCSLSVIMTFIVFYLFGLNETTKQMVKDKAFSKFNKLTRNTTAK